MSPTSKYTVFGALVAGAAALYAGPYVTLWRMRAALARGDDAALEAHVNFPSLRESLRAQLAASLARHAPDTSSVGAPRLGALLVEAAADKVIDALLTPATIASLLRGRNPISRAPLSGGAQVTRHSAYEGLSTFVVTMEHPGEANGVAMVFTRAGLGWKLSGARLPLRESYASGEARVRDLGRAPAV